MKMTGWSTIVRSHIEAFLDHFYDIIPRQRRPTHSKIVPQIPVHKYLFSVYLPSDPVVSQRSTVLHPYSPARQVVSYQKDNQCSCTDKLSYCHCAACHHTHSDLFRVPTSCSDTLLQVFTKGMVSSTLSMFHSFTDRLSSPCAECSQN